MTNSSKLKVYQEVLEKIRQFIEENQLTEGDRLPSERELAEQLNAGRSSVREALRAIELLGLIETKHGEGTFLRTYRPYHTVEIIATFVLRQSTTKKELLEIMQMLERECLNRVHPLLEEEWINELIRKVKNMDDNYHTFVFHELFNRDYNQLLFKIWYLINNFTQATNDLNKYQGLYIELLNHLKNNQINLALQKLNAIYDNVQRVIVNDEF